MTDPFEPEDEDPTEELGEPEGFERSYAFAVRDGLYNGDFSKWPVLGSNTVINDVDDNPLPAWTHASNSNIEFSIEPSAEQASGGFLKMALLTGGSTSAAATIEQTINVSGSRSRARSYIPEVHFAELDRSGLGPIVTLAATFLDAEGNATGGTASASLPCLNVYDDNVLRVVPGNYGVPPSDAAQLSIAVGISRDGGANTVTAEALVADVRVLQGISSLQIVDTNDPDAEGAGEIRQHGGLISLRPTATVDENAPAMWVGAGHVDASEFEELIVPPNGDPTSHVGGIRWDQDLELLVGADNVRERPLGSRGFVPYAYPIGFDPQSTLTGANFPVDATNLIPIWVPGHMLLQCLEIYATDTSASRSAEWRLYVDTYGVSASAVEVPGANGTFSFTGSVAEKKQSDAASAPVLLAPGLYWLAFRNSHNSNTFGLGSVSAGTAAWVHNRNKSIGASLGSTLDISTGWSNVSAIRAVRLVGRIAGEGSAYA